MDDVLERVRMCVAEAGYDPALIMPPSGRHAELGSVFVTPRGSIPIEVAWRAREVSGIGEPRCFECTAVGRLAMNEGRRSNQCDAVLRLELDCGVSRG